MKKFAGWGWTPTDFTAEKATKEALLNIRSPYILHLATHGFFAKGSLTSARCSRIRRDEEPVVTISYFRTIPSYRLERIIW
jgi:hypothetical protein